jgi:hypothetical protein
LTLKFESLLTLSLKITKQIFKYNGVEVYAGLFTVTNQLGQVCICNLVATKAHLQIEPHLHACNDSLVRYGHMQPEVFYTDNMSDMDLLQSCFPSLTLGVTPVEKYEHLPALTLPEDIQVFVLDTATGIDNAVLQIMDSVPDPGHQIVLGLDLEFNVDMAPHRVTRGIPALLQIAYCQSVYLFRVSNHLLYLLKLGFDKLF